MQHTEPEHGQDQAFLADGGELGALIRAHDWSRTPLGPPASWPQSLKTAVQIMLASRQPFWLGWGRQLTYLYNDPYQSIIGGKHPWALGQPFAEVWSEIWDVVGPMADSVMNNGRGTYVEAQLLIMERHGYQEETYYTFSYSPVLDDAGKPGGLICANTDDTRRVIGERQLATLNAIAADTTNAGTALDACRLAIEALRTNARDLPFALVYADGDDGGEVGVVAASHADTVLHEAFRRTSEQVMRSGEAAVIALEDVACELPHGAWNKAPASAAILPITDAWGAGRTGALVVGLNPYRQYDESYRNFLALIARQIGAAVAKAQAYESERRRAEALAELDRAKTTFFSNVSHEFRTPLTLMLGPLGDLAAAPDDPDEVRDNATLALRNGERLLKLVNTLLDFSRIEAGRIDAVYEAVDLPRITRDLASTFRSAVEKAGMRLDIACDPLPLPVYVDRDMWEKIVLNLVSNAFKYTLQGGIAVSVRDDHGAAVLEVRDSGCGIPDSELPRIFERFHRVAGSHGRSVEGTGIGLALVNELARLHGGTVTVDSVVGDGSTFRVRIPYGAQHLPQDRVGGVRQLASSATGAAAYVQEAERWLGHAAAADARSPRPRTVRGSILLADDNADMRDYMQRLLASDYEVIAVSDGHEALEALAHRGVDLVLTDVMMPRVDGFELLRRIRGDERHTDTPVIMLSARAGEEARVEGLDAGADDYLVKPFSARELLARVDGQIASARLRAESLRRERELRLEAETLNEIARELVSELDLQALLQKVTDIATRASGAQFGAFFYNHIDERGDSYMLYTLSGAKREDFSKHGMPRNTAIFAPTFNGEGVVRIDDVHEDPRYGHNAPHHGMPKGHLPVRSYLAAPVISRAGEVIGGLFFGHAERAVFTERAERLVAAMAAQAAIAIDNARLFERRRAAEAALQDADRRKDEFIATLAHELRNPLAPLANGLEILRRGASDPKVFAQVQTVMGRQFRHMVRLVDDLLDLSRVSRGRIELRKERIDLADALRAAVETSGPLIEASGLRLVTRMPVEPLHVEADLTRIAQVVANLLNNAAKYGGPRGGEIVLTAERAGDNVSVRVKDSGIGIPPDALPHIFEMFTQVDRSLEKSQGGLGIGLTLVRRLVELHGGSVQALSDGPGRGSEFVVTLPAAPSRSPREAQGSGAAVAALERAPLSILIADDNVDAATSLATLLEFSGHTVSVAHDGSAALERASQLKPDVILLDIGMPLMNGYDVCRAIRRQPWAAETPIVAITGWGQVEDQRRASEAGFTHHVTKPVDLNVLERLLQS